jgi:DNA invertase Pin-like site-specific DNA recombinase
MPSRFPENSERRALSARMRAGLCPLGTGLSGRFSWKHLIAKQERVRPSERTIAGLEKARNAGRVGGRPKVICDRHKVQRLGEAGLSLNAIARRVKVSKSSIHRMLG